MASYPAPGAKLKQIYKFAYVQFGQRCAILDLASNFHIYLHICELDFSSRVKNLFAAAVEVKDEVDELLQKHTFWKSVRILGWIIRFVNNGKAKLTKMG